MQTFKSYNVINCIINQCCWGGGNRKQARCIYRRLVFSERLKVLHRYTLLYLPLADSIQNIKKNYRNSPDDAHTNIHTLIQMEMLQLVNSSQLFIGSSRTIYLNKLNETGTGFSKNAKQKLHKHTLTNMYTFTCGMEPHLHLQKQHRTE